MIAYFLAILTGLTFGYCTRRVVDEYRKYRALQIKLRAKVEAEPQPATIPACTHPNAHKNPIAVSSIESMGYQATAVLFCCQDCGMRISGTYAGQFTLADFQRVRGETAELRRMVGL